MNAMKFKLVRIADGVETAIAGELLVGRLEECGLRITQGLPSRRHAQLTTIDQTVWVEDLGSVNGTFINGKRITAKSQLSSGDFVRFDVEEFKFHAIVETPPQVASAPTMFRPLAQELAERPPPKKVAPPKVEASQPLPATRPIPPPVAESKSVVESKPVDAEKIAAKPAAKPIEKPAEKTADKSSDSLIEKLAQKRPESHAEKSVEQPIQKAVEKPAEKAVEKPVEKAVEKAVEKPSAEAAPEASGMFKRPGAWADPDFDGGANKTKFMDPAAMKAMLNSPKVAPVSGAPVDAPCFIVTSGAARGVKIGLSSDRGVSEWTIGSSADCQITIAGDGVSALHAKLINDGKRWKLVDQMSANGTYVNGKRSTVSYLGSGDRIALGPVECEIRFPASARTEPEPGPTESNGKKPMLIAAAVGGALVLIAIVWAVWLR